MPPRALVVAGAGGMGRESLQWVRDAFPDRDVDGFVDDVATGEVVGLPVMGPLTWLRSVGEVDIVVGFGHHHPRQLLIELVDDTEGAELLTVVHPTAHVGPTVTLGRGTIVAPNVTIARDGVIGDACIINFGAQIGHDALVEKTVFIGPGAAIGGNVTIREYAWVGIGATVLEDLEIGAGAIVGGGATVTRDVVPGATVVGIPARDHVA